MNQTDSSQKKREIYMLKIFLKVLHRKSISVRMTLIWESNNTGKNMKKEPLFLTVGNIKYAAIICK